MVAGLSCWAPCVWGRGALGHPGEDRAPHSTKAGASLGMENVLLEGQTALRWCMAVALMPAGFTQCPGRWARVHFYPQRWSPAGFSQLLFPRFLQRTQPLLYLLLFLRWRKFSKAKARQEYRTTSLQSRSPWPVYVAREIAAAGGEFDKSVPEQGSEADKQTNNSSAPAYMLCLCHLLFPPFSAWKNGFNKKNVTWKCPSPSPI